jgi:hypothetical protein
MYWTDSSSERGEFRGCTINVYRRCAGSTQGGSSVGRECNAVIAASGLGAAVEAASITIRQVNERFGRRH